MNFEEHVIEKLNQIERALNGAEGQNGLVTRVAILEEGVRTLAVRFRGTVTAFVAVVVGVLIHLFRTVIK